MQRWLEGAIARRNLIDLHSNMLASISLVYYQVLSSISLVYYQVLSLYVSQFLSCVYLNSNTCFIDIVAAKNQKIAQKQANNKRGTEWGSEQCYWQHRSGNTDTETILY